MSTAKGLVFALLPPVLAFAVVGIGLGGRSVANLAMFVLMWSLVVSPLVVALALTGSRAARRFQCDQLRHFVLGGFLSGSVISGVWFYEALPSLQLLLLSVLGGVVGTASSALFWRHAVRTPPPSNVSQQTG